MSDAAICPACGVAVTEPTVNMPREAQCYRDHSVIDGCLCEPAIAKCRGPWILEVFKPVPPEEAAAMANFLTTD